MRMLKNETKKEQKQELNKTQTFLNLIDNHCGLDFLFEFEKNSYLQFIFQHAECVFA